ncbi:MAG TPA: sialidase family protein [Chthoniobacterales bacterium]|jgi:hypothetical protein
MMNPSLSFAPSFAARISKLTRLLCAVSWMVATAVGAGIEWDRSTDRVVSHTDRAASYPRAKRLSNGEILLGYHHSAGYGEYGTFVTLRKSRDDGKTWYETKDVEGPEEDYWGFSNLDFQEIAPGKIMLVTAARGKGEKGDREFETEGERSGLRVRVSEDFGETWSQPSLIPTARGRVWEPSLVLLHSGEWEIYYARETQGPVVNTRPLDKEVSKKNLMPPQQIEVIRSLDQGKTWGKPTIISNEPLRRAGMPVATVLESGQPICIEESVGDVASPYIVRPKKEGPPERSLTQNRFGFGGAPFLLSVPGRGTLLTYHSEYMTMDLSDDIPMRWMFGNVWVQQGDAEARVFGDGNRPWPLMEKNTGAFFASLMMKNDDTVVALASFRTDAPDGATKTEVRWIEGRIQWDPAMAPKAPAGSASSAAPSSLPAAAPEVEAPAANPE